MRHHPAEATEHEPRGAASSSTPGPNRYGARRPAVPRRAARVSAALFITIIAACSSGAETGDSDEGAGSSGPGAGSGGNTKAQCAQTCAAAEGSCPELVEVDACVSACAASASEYVFATLGTESDPCAVFYLGPRDEVPCDTFSSLPCEDGPGAAGSGATSGGPTGSGGGGASSGGGGAPSCSEVGEPCSNFQGCCSALACPGGEGLCCVAPGLECTDDSQCCPGFHCAVIETESGFLDLCWGN